MSESPRLQSEAVTEEFGFKYMVFQMPQLLAILCKSIADGDTDSHSKKVSAIPMPIIPDNCFADTDTFTDT
jgi:hypothetical protein